MWLSSKKFSKLFCKISYLRGGIKSGCVSNTRNNKIRLYIQHFQMVPNSLSQIILCKLHPYRFWNIIIGPSNNRWVVDFPSFQLLCRFRILLMLRLSKSSINIISHCLVFQEIFHYIASIWIILSIQLYTNWLKRIIFLTHHIWLTKIITECNKKKTQQIRLSNH